MLWDNVKALLQPCQNAYVLFDDTVLDKRHSASIELTRRQSSGNEHRVLRGIGLVSCVYVNAETGQFWVVDYRLYDPEGDGQSKLDHVAAMLDGMVYSKHLAFATVLSGKTSYQIKHGMLSDYLIEQLKHPSVQMILA
ncbi:hypothetical protein H6F67_09990 [Microcoleus sp. FACHB-1515]|nr:hypothetical protein [Microcoleus sp. FACHB-1515]